MFRIIISGESPGAYIAGKLVIIACDQEAT